MPGLLAPVEREGRLLVDGGLLDNLPADVVRQMGADVVIAVDVTTDQDAWGQFAGGMQRRRFVPEALVDILDVLGRSLALVVEEVNRRNLEQAHPDLLIRPVIPPGVTILTGLNRAAETIVAGEKQAQAMLPELKKLI